MTATNFGLLRPARRLENSAPYAVPTPTGEIDLWLNSNEGMKPPAELLERAGDRFQELARCYPSAATLERMLAERFGLTPDHVLVTAGGDDALYRACLALLEPGRQIVLPMPSFDMLHRYARHAGGEVVEVPWLDGRYPVDAVSAACTDQTALLAVVTPNNPTGSIACADDIRRLSLRVPQALLLVDLAYAEFADEDVTEAALRQTNALVLRTFSKAWGLAGLRVGYALGPPRVIQWLRTVGNPYAVSGLSAALAAAWLTEGHDAMIAFVSRVRQERRALEIALTEIGAKPLPSQANFVLARFQDAASTWAELVRRGIVVRAFPGHARLSDHLRITCPGESGAFARLLVALQESVHSIARSCSDE